jgi:hypothetical protein
MLSIIANTKHIGPKNLRSTGRKAIWNRAYHSRNLSDSPSISAGIAPNFRALIDFLQTLTADQSSSYTQASKGINITKYFLIQFSDCYLDGCRPYPEAKFRVLDRLRDASLAASVRLRHEFLG